jgi:hypothetical protein
MPLGPAEVHPQEHLGPVGRFGAAGAGTDRQQSAALVVFAGEEELGPLPGEVPFERGGLAVELRGQLGITGFLDELEGGQDVLGARVKAAPELGLGS